MDDVEKKPGVDWKLYAIFAVFGLFALTIINGLFAPGNVGDPTGEASARAGQPFVGEPEMIVGDEDSQMVTFSAVLLPGAEVGHFAIASRNLCARYRICQVLGWRDASKRARNIPMMEREAAALTADYSMNRLSGEERTLRDCAVWPGEPAECLAR